MGDLGNRRTAIVTGAAGTLGTAIVHRLVQDGLAVVAADVELAGAQELAQEIDSNGHDVLPCRADVADYASVEAMVAGALAWQGRLDVLVNNAGVIEPRTPAWELPLEEWHRVMRIDLTGVFYCTRAALPSMLERGWGRIVNISSIAGKEGKHNPPAYAAAKAGVIGLTKSIAFEVAARGIMVNAITPGSIWSPHWERMSEADLQAFRARHPVGRLGKADEVAAMVSWLASDACSFSTGAVFDISGGRAGY